jgi:uncharacterized protein YdeI (YjbR/CyaY-like superfamily)
MAAPRQPRPAVVEPELCAPDRAAWRAWLAAHHATARVVWLVRYGRHTGKASLSLDDAVEEALCFGWIDGRVRRLDAERHALRFTPRRPGSIWSETNRARARRLIRAGLMTEAGLRLVEAAKRSGEWRRARMPRAAAVPADLATALDANERARTFFAGLAPSYRTMYVAWVLDARRDETRRRRIRIVVERAARGQKPGIDL